jgi:hypothetical protein
MQIYETLATCSLSIMRQTVMQMPLSTSCGEAESVLSYRSGPVAASIVTTLYPADTSEALSTEVAPRPLSSCLGGEVINGC